MKSCYIYNQGCGSRTLDSQRMAYYLQINNYKIIDDPKNADYIILFSCGVTNLTAENCFNLIQEFQKYKGKLIVAGCIPAIQKKRLADVFKGKMISTEDLNKNPDKVDQLFPDIKIKFRQTGDIDAKLEKDDVKNPIDEIKKILFSSNFISYLFLYNLCKIILILIGDIDIKYKFKFMKNFFGEKSSIIHYYKSLSNYPLYPLRVSWGCTGNCAYCGIKHAVGPHISKPSDIIINEFKKGLKLGYKDFLIFSEDTGAYGTDIGSSFPELLEKIVTIDGDYRIFLEDFNPVWVVKYIDKLEEIFKNKKISGLLCPMQSGSSRILKLMNRFSDVNRIRDSYERLKKSNPNLIIIIHIMVGFPTETEEDLNKTFSFITDNIFDSGQFFEFSCVPNIEAEKIEPKVPSDILHHRLKKQIKMIKKQGYNVLWMNKGLFFYRK